MCARCKSSQGCRNRGADPLADRGHCTCLVQLGPAQAPEGTAAHACAGCCRERAADAPTDGYVRLGLLA